MNVILNFFKALFTLILVKIAFGRVREKGTKCALPSCKTLTTHRGGYCCAEHKLLNKEMHKRGV